MPKRFCPIRAKLRHDLANAAQGVAELARLTSAEANVTEGTAKIGELREKLTAAREEWKRIHKALNDHQQEHGCSDRSYEAAGA